MYKLFIVDDNPLDRRGIAGLFQWETFGCQVAGLFGNAMEALSAAESVRPDIVLTDVQMPVIDGIEFGQRLRSGLPAVELIFMSSYDDFAFAHGALQLEAIDYVLKPIRKQALEAAVAKVAGKLDKAQMKELEREELLRHIRQPFPQSPGQSGAADAEESELPYYERIVSRIKAIVAAKYRETITVQEIAGEVFLSLSHANNIFKSKTGLKIFDYLTEYRMERAKSLLRHPDSKIYQVAMQVGYTNKSHFCLVFRKHAGVSPSEYKDHFK
ncbi:two-component system, response regulator YesN [Paenibacillus sp. UNC496MF]|uniref:response regulator transcription factor n=1 Tax=Paenibacillus sp. UNC496MF TaxID=1502753 RepID=UPI0008EF2AEB|nr:response regulator [Paenibacillus sp. UNC496MF]SFJ93050.1 two-component system, response regulator YesN [Paenibacillus sp. UNC496MF]